MSEYNKLAEALAEYDLTDNPSYSAIVLKYSVERITLSRRHREITVSRTVVFLQTSIQCLNHTQEEVLIKYINRITKRRMPPITHIIRNLAEEILKRAIRKN